MNCEAFALLDTPLRPNSEKPLQYQGEIFTLKAIYRQQKFVKFSNSFLLLAKWPTLLAYQTFVLIDPNNFR